MAHELFGGSLSFATSTEALHVLFAEGRFASRGGRW